MVIPYALLTLLVNPQANISVEIAGKTLEAAEAELSKAFGKPVQVGNSLKRLPILIYANRVSLNELQENIAWSVNAEWEDRGKYWLLTQTESQKREEKQFNERKDLMRIAPVVQEAKLKVKTLAPFDTKLAIEVSKSVTDLTASVLQSPNYGTKEQRDRLTAAQNMEPMARFRDRFISTCPMDILLSALDHERRIVFSNRPNKMQSKLNFDLTELYRLMVEEQETYRTITGPNPNGGQRISFSNYGGSFPKLPRQGASSRFDRVLLIPTSGYTSGFQCIFLDDKSKVLAQAPIHLTNNEDEPDLAKKREREIKLITPKKEVELTPSAKTFNDATSLGLVRGLVDKKFLVTLADVKNKDFSAYSIAENLKSVAGNRNVVMTLHSDDFALRIPNLFLETIKEKYSWKETDSWTAIRPENLFQWRKHEPKRETMEAAANLLLKDFDLRLDTRANVASLSPITHFGNSFFHKWCTTFQAETGIRDDHKALRIWHSLPPDSKRILVNLSDGDSIKVPFGKLSPETKERIVDLIFNHHEFGFQVSAMLRSDDSANFEPTEKFPEGITQESILTISRKKHLMVSYPMQPGAKALNRTYVRAEQLDLSMSFSRQSDPAPSNNQDKQSELQIGEQAEYTFELGGETWNVTDTIMDRTKNYSIESLPKDYTEAYKKGLERSKNRRPFGPGRPGKTGGNIPPTP